MRARSGFFFSFMLSLPTTARLHAALGKKSRGRAKRAPKKWRKERKNYFCSRQKLTSAIFVCWIQPQSGRGKSKNWFWPKIIFMSAKRFMNSTSWATTVIKVLQRSLTWTLIAVSSFPVLKWTLTHVGVSVVSALIICQCGLSARFCGGQSSVVRGGEREDNELPTRHEPESPSWGGGSKLLDVTAFFFGQKIPLSVFPFQVQIDL